MEKLFFSSSFIPSDASPRLLTLMVDSIERIISRHPEPQKLIAQFSPERIRHIVDWLVASDL